MVSMGVWKTWGEGENSVQKRTVVLDSVEGQGCACSLVLGKSNLFVLKDCVRGTCLHLLSRPIFFRALVVQLHFPPSLQLQPNIFDSPCSICLSGSPRGVLKHS